MRILGKLFILAAVLCGGGFQLAAQSDLGLVDGETFSRLASKSLSPFVPTPMPVVEKMLELAQLRENEVLYDLGSGDGRIVVLAAQKYGARCVGIELDPRLCRIALGKIQEQRLGERVRIIEDDMLEQDVSSADVVTVYLVASAMEPLKRHLEKALHHGMRIVIVNDDMPGWNPTTSITVLSEEKKPYNLTLYVVSRPGEWVSFSKFGRKH